VLCGALLRPRLAGLSAARAWRLGATAGALGALATGALVVATLAMSGEEFLPAAQLVGLTYLPLALAEALIGGIIVGFLYRVEPELLVSPMGVDDG
jgi:cobalt/nickel transport system permease protein